MLGRFIENTSFREQSFFFKGNSLGLGENRALAARIVYNGKRMKILIKNKRTFFKCDKRINFSIIAFASITQINGFLQPFLLFVSSTLGLASVSALSTDTLTPIQVYLTVGEVIKGLICI